MFVVLCAYVVYVVCLRGKCCVQCVCVVVCVRGIYCVQCVCVVVCIVFVLLKFGYLFVSSLIEDNRNLEESWSSKFALSRVTQDT